VQRHCFANEPGAERRSAYEVGLAFDRGGAGSIHQVCKRSERSKRIGKSHDSAAMQHRRPGTEFVANRHFRNDLIRRGTDNLDSEKARKWQRYLLQARQQVHSP
jgi:hypothetical protein